MVKVPAASLATGASGNKEIGLGGWGGVGTGVDFFCAASDAATGGLVFQLKGGAAGSQSTPARRKLSMWSCTWRHISSCERTGSMSPHQTFTPLTAHSLLVRFLFYRHNLCRPTLFIIERLPEYADFACKIRIQCQFHPLLDADARLPAEFSTGLGDAEFGGWPTTVIARRMMVGGLERRNRRASIPGRKRSVGPASTGRVCERVGVSRYP